MTDAHRPRARGYFEEPDEAALPLIVALGRLVLSAAMLEKALQMELIRVHYERAHASDDPEELLLCQVMSAICGLRVLSLRAGIASPEAAIDQIAVWPGGVASTSDGSTSQVRCRRSGWVRKASTSPRDPPMHVQSSSHSVEKSQE